jgi:protein tyrosine kinase modulator
MLPGRKYTPEDIVAIVWHRKWLLLAGVLVCTAIAVAVSLRLPNQYRSETLILVIPQRIPESYVRSTVTMRIEDRLRSISQEILSRSRLERVIAEFDLYPEERKRQPMEVVVELMRSKVVVDTVRDDAFKVSFTSTVPRTAMIVTERLASMFIDENSKDRSVMAEGTNQFLESQLVDARAQLLDHEKKLEAFRRRNSGELPSQLQTNLQVIQGNQSQIQSLNESINRDRDRRLVLEKQVADALAAPVDGAASADASAGGPVDRLANAREELRVLELRLKPEHPDVVAKKRMIADLERAVEQQAGSAAPGDQQAAKPASAAEAVRQARARQFQIEIAKVDRQIASKEADVARLRQAVTDTQRRVDAVPGHESELTDLMRDYETLQKTYSTLLAKKEDSKISANLERQQVSEQFKILDPARLPETPFSPNRLYIALGAAAFGLALAIGFAGFLEYRDTTLRTEDEILRTLVLPVIAAIPMMHAAADIRRHRRKGILTAALAASATVGVVAATLWRLGLLKGIR